VGNPFITEAYVDRPYYKMNADGSDIEAVSEYGTTAIPMCTGVVINTTFADEVTFRTSAPNQQSSANNGSLQMTLVKGDLNTRNAKVHDKAIVSFNEDSKLEKFIFNDEHAKLYIPQDGYDYAIAFSDRRGEVPVNFRAQETGHYTIIFDSDMDNLSNMSLIDQFEGVTVDLSSTPSYTFMASVADRENRFMIVFKNSEFSDGSDIFAYQNGSDIIVSGEGELQVFDLMGRMVMNQYINGVQTVEKPSQTGVYIFRLNEMTQKIVIR